MQFKIIGECKKVKREDKIKKYLDKLPDGTLLTSKELGRATGCNYINIMGNKEILIPYRCVYVGRTSLWGNPKTIKEYIKCNSK
jgi:hypothetical protein